MRSLLFARLDRWLAPPPKAAKVAWLSGCNYAHRGLHSAGVPENSLAAFSAAMAKGMGIECDVQRAGDGRAVVFHDTTLDRLTGEEGLVISRGADALNRIVLKGGTETIPTLRQTLMKVGGTVPLLIEIKNSPHSGQRTRALCMAVMRDLEGYTGPYAVMSFNPRVVRWFARHAPLTVRGLVVTEEGDKALLGKIRRRLKLWYTSPDFLAYDIRDLPSRFATVQRKRGLPVLTWTVRSAEHRERAASHADASIAEGPGAV